MDELVKLWLAPEYLAMLAVITLTVKLLVVPVLKSFFKDEFGNSTTHPQGYTPLIVAYVGAIILAFMWKLLFPFGVWDVRAVVMVVLVGVFAAFSAIGMNVTTQAVQGKDVSISSR